MTDNPSPVIAHLSARMDALEQRVAELEDPGAAILAAAAIPAAAPTPRANPLETKAVQRGEPASLATAGGTFSVLGRALLGIAGAYLLRALAEAGTFPPAVMAGLAIAYAGMWLAGAARVRSATLLPGITYSATSAFILAPLLWELTLRFRILSPAVSAAVLGAFALAGLALTWKRSIAPVFWVAYATSLLGALVLMIATQDMTPFLCAILLIALTSEVAQGAGHLPNGRILSAVACDVAAASLLYIYSMAEAARPGYSQVSPPVLVALASIPFFLYVSSITLQSLFRRRNITLFERVQIVVTFLIASYGSAALSSGRDQVVVGTVCVTLSAVGYSVALLRFGDPGLSRNLRAYTLGSAALLLLGCYLWLPEPWLALSLGLAAMMATMAGRRRGRSPLLIQGAAYLLAGSVFSGLLEFDQHALLGSHPLVPSWIMGVVAGCALLSYGLGGRAPRSPWNAGIPQLLLAALVAGTGASFLLLLMSRSLSEAGNQPGWYATGVPEFLQTLILCAVALGAAAAAAGSRWRRPELIWLAYGTLVLTAAKILLEDARHGHLLLIAASIVLYATTLILLPRLASLRRKEQAQAAES